MMRANADLRPRAKSPSGLSSLPASRNGRRRDQRAMAPTSGTVSAKGIGRIDPVALQPDIEIAAVLAV
jgi:hypothetical protein